MLIFKKTILLRAMLGISLLIGLIQNAFAQQYSSSNPQFGWGGWTQNSCFKGIYIRVQKAYFNKSAKQWYWNWQMQNRYAKRVAISWAFYDKTEGKPTRTNARHTFEPNEIWKGGNFGSETELSWILENICFAFKQYNGTLIDDCSDDPATYGKGYYHAECDNGTPNYKAYNGMKVSNAPNQYQNQHTNSTNTAQNQNYSTNQSTVYDSRTGVTPAKFNGDLGSFLGKNMRYPDKAAESNIQGKVNIKIIIETDGSISATVIDGPPALREEALRVVNLTSGNWTPAKLNNSKVRYSLTLPITFNLSD